MRVSTSRIVRVAGVTLLLTASLFLAGRWLQGMYGLDPPYSVFYLGLVLELAAFPLPLAAAMWLLIAHWRDKRGCKTLGP
jgi:hypothetical protein